MPAPNWLPAKSVSISINGAAQPCTDGEYKETAGKFDCTTLLAGSNANGLLAEEHSNDTVATALRCNTLVDSNALKNLAVGVAYPCSWVCALEQTHTGTLRLENRSKAGGARGAYKVAIDGMFTGIVSGQ